MEGRESLIPGVNVVVHTRAIVILHDTAQLDVIFLVFDSAGTIRVKSKIHGSTCTRLDVDINLAASVLLASVAAALGPPRSIVFHKVVLVRAPQAKRLMLEELLHPVVVVIVFEKAEECKMRIRQVTVHLSASCILGSITGCSIPFTGRRVMKLILANASSLVVQVDVLYDDGRRKWKSGQTPYPWLTCAWSS